MFFDIVSYIFLNLKIRAIQWLRLIFLFPAPICALTALTIFPCPAPILAFIASHKIRLNVPPAIIALMDSVLIAFPDVPPIAPTTSPPEMTARSQVVSKIMTC